MRTKFLAINNSERTLTLKMKDDEKGCYCDNARLSFEPRMIKCVDQING